MSIRNRRTATPVVVNPDRASHDRVTQQIINTYHQELKVITTDWKSVTNRHDQVVALVPTWRIEFKDGSDYVMDLAQANKAVQTGAQHAH